MKIRDKNNDVFFYCLEYYIKNKKFPLLDEIASYFNFSRERARQHLEKLEKRGLVVKLGWKKRGYVVKLIDILPPDLEDIEIIKQKVELKN